MGDGVQSHTARRVASGADNNGQDNAEELAAEIYRTLSKNNENNDKSNELQRWAILYMDTYNYFDTLVKKGEELQDEFLSLKRAGIISDITEPSIPGYTKHVLKLEPLGIKVAGLLLAEKEKRQ